MNFYKRYIGDIQAKTGGLTLAEFGAYDRLLDHYYSTEKAVPADEVYRICRAMGGAERKVVDKVLGKFFEMTPTGWIQGKAEEQIAKAQPLIEAARANGKLGGRPPKPKTPQEPTGFQNQNPAETQLVKALQSQSQILSPDGEKKERRKRPLPQPLDVSDEVWRDYLTTRKADLTETALAGIRREADKAGYTLEQALQTSCERGWRGFKADWLQGSQRRSAQPHKHSAAAAGIFGKPRKDTFDV